MNYDLIVIGGGSGGVRAGRMDAAMNAKVLLIESKDMGGTCVNVGCVPKKLFSYAAHVHDEVEDAKGFGYEGTLPAFDWPTLRENKNKEISRLNGIYDRILENAGVEVVRGFGQLKDKNTVVVKLNEGGEETYTGKHILVCTGGKPFVPEGIEGIEHAIVSDAAFHLDTWPKKAIVVGGGYIAVEFAGIFNGTGCDTTLVHRGDGVLRGFDGDVRAHLAEEMQKKGMALKLSTEVTKIELVGEQKRVTMSDGSESLVDLVLFATGRVPLTEHLYQDGFSLKQNKKGAIVVDENYLTSEDNIYAIGDVIDRVNLTPVALAQGMVIAHRLYGDGRKDLAYDNIATAVFSSPEIGTVGMSEEQAREKFDRVAVYKSTFTPLKNTLSPRKEKTLMKLVVDADSDRVLGCHMVGPAGAEITQGLSIALNMGATKAQFDVTIGIHPTAAEEFVTMRTPHAIYDKNEK